MSTKISPRDFFDMNVGEEHSCELDLTPRLKTKTVSSYTYKIYNSSDTDVTDTFGGGSSISSGTITFGIKAVSVGRYTLKFVVTCEDLLPDEVTQYEFNITLTLVVV